MHKGYRIALVWFEHLLDQQFVRPAVSEVVFVDQPLPLAQKMVKSDLALVLMLRTTVFINAWIADAAVSECELVQVRVRPAHRLL